MIISSCASTSKKEKKETIAYLENNTLYYNGSLSVEANNVIYSLYEKSKIKPSMIFVSSPGGSINLGLDPGEWIFENDLDVTVGKICASSCANYLLPAGRSKYLHKDSILLWHGNSYQKNVDNYVTQKEEYFINWRNREDAFHQKVGVNPKIGVYGQKDFTLWNFIYHYFRDTAGFDYSIEDMQLFGITNIHLINNEWNWRAYHKDISVNRVKVDISDL